jgi:hypothetical protein
MAQRKLEMEADPLMQAIARTCCSPESFAPFEVATYWESTLDDHSFKFVTELRLGIHVHPGRTTCKHCSKAAGPTRAHDLNCIGTNHVGVNSRHNNVQHATLTQIQRWNIPGLQLVRSSPRYDEHGFIPKNSQRRTRDDQGELVVMADALVDIPATANRRGGRKLVDFVVSGPTQDNLERARKSTGAIAQAAEERKIEKVKNKFVVTPELEYKLAPFGVDVMGTHGPKARRLLSDILDSDPRSDEELNPEEDPIPFPDPDMIDSSTPDLKHFRNRRLWRAKAAIVAAVLKSNAIILLRYDALEHPGSSPLRPVRKSQQNSSQAYVEVPQFSAPQSPLPQSPFARASPSVHSGPSSRVNVGRSSRSQ